jgi:heptosyltransferase-1
VREKIRPPRLEFPVDPAAQERISEGLGLRGVGDFAILNPGAGWGAKRWPAERYGEVARQLAKDGLHCQVNFGPGEEDLFNEVSEASGGVVRPTKPSISGLIALTRRAKLFIGGDTGPLHLAAALRVPVVAIFGPTDPARNGPYGTRSIVLRNPASPTTHTRNPRPDGGMLEIGVDVVVSAARSLLAQGDGGGQACPPHTRPPQTPPSTDGAHG